MKNKIKAVSHEFKHFMGIEFLSYYKFLSINEIKEIDEYRGVIIAEFETICSDCGKISKKIKSFNFDTSAGIRRIEEVKKGSEWDKFEFKYCDKELKVLKIPKENYNPNRYDFITSRTLEETVDFVFNFKGPE